MSIRWEETEVKRVAHEYIRLFPAHVPTEKRIQKAQEVLPYERRRPSFIGPTLQRFRASVQHALSHPEEAPPLEPEYESTVDLRENGEPLQRHNGFVSELPLTQETGIIIEPARLKESLPPPRRTTPSGPHIITVAAPSDETIPDKLIQVLELTLDLLRVPLSTITELQFNEMQRQRCLNIAIAASDQLYHFEELLRRI